jgi:hypothetical protein
LEKFQTKASARIFRTRWSSKNILKQKRVGRTKFIHRWEDIEDRGKVYETRKAQGDVYI